MQGAAVDLIPWAVVVYSVLSWHGAGADPPLSPWEVTCAPYLRASSLLGHKAREDAQG